MSISLGAHRLRFGRRGPPESTMSKNRQMAESQLEDGLQVVVVNLGDIFSQVPEERRHFDPRSDGQKRGSGPREFSMHARSPPAAFRHTFLLTPMRAELKTNKNKVAEQRNFLCGAAC